MAQTHSLSLRLWRGAKYCDEYVCLFLFVRALIYLKNHTAELHQIFVHVAYSRGDDGDAMSCISGFVDDIMFLHNGLCVYP